MKKITFILFSIISFSFSQQEESIKFYVSPNGNDSNIGTLDEPFKTIEHAKQTIRKLSDQERHTDIDVYLRGGTYILDKTIVFELEDSGLGDTKITYLAYKDETPVISSGVQIKGWKKLKTYPKSLPEVAKGNIWVAKMPKGMERFYTLFDGDKRLARTRKEGFEFKNIEYVGAKSMNVLYEKDRYLLRKLELEGEEILKSWPNLEDIEVGFAPVPWTMNLLTLESVDEEKREAWTVLEANAPPAAKKSHTKPWVENVIDHLETPGQWVLNTQERNIYYWPENGEPSNNIIAPKLKEYFRIEGNIDYQGAVDIPTKNIVFKGITFQHGERDSWWKGHKGWGIQHDWDKFDRGNAMLRFRGAENCEVLECRFTNSGGSAIRLDLYAQNITIKNNMIDFVGHMGILLCGYGPGTKDVNKNNTITNNVIHHVGAVMKMGAAIFICQSVSNIISNNLIHHVPRKAVGVCGIRVPILQKRNIDFDEGSKTIRWNEIDDAIEKKGTFWQRYTPFLHAKDNIVENNEVYRALEELADGSALNVSGAGEGNIMRNNFAHHITSHASGVMRTDDWQRGTTFENNIIYMANVSGIVHKGYNHIINNILVDCSSKESIRFASYPDEEADYGSKIQHNIFYESLNAIKYYNISYRASEGISKPEDCDADTNIFYCAQNVEQAEKFVESKRKDGIEKNSIIADPLFEDVANANFKLKPESPALKLGFKQIDMSKIGLKTDEFPKKY
ncbi:MAG: right-handed parallel beta-helix repeat-containing protein, partial [Bacteroidota bacterium]|nr:right-handed parallel beta-helix repeat-containing protein [Bacteroidota bacterium]